MNSSTPDWLITLAADLHASAHRFAGTDESEVPSDEALAIRALIRLQCEGETDINRSFQLPELPAGQHVRPRLLVVGINPGLGPNEDCPRLDSSLNEYVAYYERRFDMDRRNERGILMSLDQRLGHWLPLKHYQFIEGLLPASLGPTPLSTSVLYADSIPWKTSRSPYSRANPQLKVAMLRLASAHLERVITEVQPHVVLSFGDAATAALGAQRTEPPAPTRLILKDWAGVSLASKHRAAFFKGVGSKRAYFATVRVQLAGILP